MEHQIRGTQRGEAWGSSIVETSANITICKALPTGGRESFALHVRTQLRICLKIFASRDSGTTLVCFELRRLISRQQHSYWRMKTRRRVLFVTRLTRTLRGYWKTRFAVIGNMAKALGVTLAPVRTSGTSHSLIYQLPVRRCCIKIICLAKNWLTLKRLE